MSCVALAPGAEDNPLAQWLSRRIDASVTQSGRAELRALRAAVCVVAPDRRLSVTLRFDHGHVTVHDGMMGIPDVTFCADLPALEALAALPLGRSRLDGGLERVKRTLADFAGGQVKIYGLLRHPRVVVRVLRLLAGGDDET